MPALPWPDKSLDVNRNRMSVQRVKLDCTSLLSQAWTQSSQSDKSPKTQTSHSENMFNHVIDLACCPTLVISRQHALHTSARTAHGHKSTKSAFFPSPSIFNSNGAKNEHNNACYADSCPDCINSAHAHPLHFQFK